MRISKKDIGLLLLIYCLTILAGNAINYLFELFNKCTQLGIDNTFVEIVTFVITNVYGVLITVMGYGDFQDFTGFFFIPFIYGGIIWLVVYLLIQNLIHKYNRNYIFMILSRVFIIFGVAISVLGVGFLMIVAIFEGGFALIYIPYVLVIAVLLIVFGLILKSKRFR